MASMLPMKFRRPSRPYLDSAPIPTVIKADGLALGKGVIIAATRDEAKEAVVEIMRYAIFYIVTGTLRIVRCGEVSV